MKKLALALVAFLGLAAFGASSAQAGVSVYVGPGGVRVNTYPSYGYRPYYNPYYRPNYSPYYGPYYRPNYNPYYSPYYNPYYNPYRYNPYYPYYPYGR